MATVTASILVTCTKNIDIQPGVAPLEPRVAAVKEVFGQYLQTLPKARVANFARLARQGSQRTIHWELAQPVETGTFAGIRIPVSYPGQRTAIIDTTGNKHPLGQNTWLLIQDDTTGGYRFSMLTALPTGEFLAGPGGRYSGVLEVTDWNGELLAAYIYDQGKFLAMSSPARAARANHPTLLMGVDNTGEYICVPVMAETCVGNPADPNDNYICNTQQVGQQCYFTGGNNGNPDFPPLDELPEPEVWYGGGGNNNEGNSPNAPAIDTTMSDDFYNNVRLRCIMEKLMRNGFYKNTLNKFIGENKPINLHFKLSTTMQDRVLGNTQPVPLAWNATNIDININSNELNRQPSVQWALTLIHEGVHAEMYRVLLSVKGPSNLNNINFPTLFRYYSEYERPDAQHAYMANHYIDVLGKALWEYDNKKFSLDHYKAMAWQGLEGTDVYVDKPQTEKDAINAKKLNYSKKETIQVATIMEIKNYLLVVITILLTVLSGKAQTINKGKSAVYVYFEQLIKSEDKISMFKLEQEEYGYDIYVFEIWEPRKRALFNTVNKEKYKVVDSTYVKKIDLKSPEWGINEENYALDINSASTKYDHIFFVEKLNDNKFKIIEVVSYIGSIFFAPERKRQ